MHISLAVCGTNHTFLSMILCVRITLIDNALPLLTVYNHPNLILSLLCLSVYYGRTSPLASGPLAMQLHFEKILFGDITIACIINDVLIM